MRRFRWAAALAAVPLCIATCSNDGDEDRSDTPRSSRVTTPTTTAPTGTTTPPENAACALVTRADAEAVFGEPARPGMPLAAGEDAACAWEAGDEDEASYQSLQFRLYEGSDISTYSVTNAPVNITVQRSVGGRGFAFNYVAGSGDADAKRAAVNDLADSVIERAS